MPMSKPPNIENRLYYSLSRSQSLIVSIGFGSNSEADPHDLSVSFGKFSPDPTLLWLQEPVDFSVVAF